MFTLMKPFWMKNCAAASFPDLAMPVIPRIILSMKIQENIIVMDNIFYDGRIYIAIQFYLKYVRKTCSTD